MGTLAKQLADQLSGLDPHGWFQSLTHSIGPRTIILVIVSTIIFVVYHCLHAKIVKTEQTLMVRTLLTNIINQSGGIVRECLTEGFLRAVSHESFVPLQAEQHAAPRD